LQNDLLGRHGANAANGQRLDRLFDVLVDLDVRNLLFGLEQQNFLLGQLQTGFIGHHVPAAESFVIAAVTVHRHADVHLTGIQLFGGLGQGGFHGTKHHVALNVLFT